MLKYKDDTLTKEEIKELKDKYAVIQRTWMHEGDIISYDSNVWIRCNTPFETKEAAKAFCERNNIKSYYRKGRGDERYGSIGEMSQEVKILKLTGNKLNKYFAFNSYIVNPDWISNG